MQYIEINTSAIIAASTNRDIRYLSAEQQKIFMFGHPAYDDILFDIYQSISEIKIKQLLKYKMIENFILEHPRYKIR